MEIALVIYIVIGLIHSFNKTNNQNPGRRPMWATDPATPFILKILGFISIAAIWPLSMLSR